MESSLAPPPAARSDHAAASLADALDLERAHIQCHVEAQRRVLAKIQHELNQHLGRLPKLGDPNLVAELQRALDESRAEAERLRSQPAAQDDELGRIREEIEPLRREVERLAAENRRLSDELAQGPPSQPADAASTDSELLQEHEDLKRRYQMAIDDLKAERGQVAQLESRLARSGSSGGAAPIAAGPSDWESQKRRLLAALEEDFDAENQDDRRDRMSVEDAIRRTDEAIAAKNRELEQLQSLLQEQSANVGAMAVGAAAVAEVLDKDEVVRQERQNLQALQDEWREKLRQAEVEISVQRAKLARHQAELEERARQIEQQARGLPVDEGDEPREKEKPIRGRWLRRLGLKGSDEE
jgi:chromosome segregation ATPase